MLLLKRTKLTNTQLQYKKNVYIDELADIVNKYNNTYHSTINMKPADIKFSTYIVFNNENNKEDPKFEVSGHVKISKYKNIFAKCCTPNWSEEDFMIRKAKKTVLRTYFIIDLNGEKIAGAFYRKEFKREGDKQYIKWKGHNTCFNSWIDKKDIIVI